MDGTNGLGEAARVAAPVASNALNVFPLRDILWKSREASSSRRRHAGTARFAATSPATVSSKSESPPTSRTVSVDWDGTRI